MLTTPATPIPPPRRDAAQRERADADYSASLPGHSMTRPAPFGHWVFIMTPKLRRAASYRISFFQEGVDIIRD